MTLAKAAGVEEVRRPTTGAVAKLGQVLDDFEARGESATGELWKEATVRDVAKRLRSVREQCRSWLGVRVDRIDAQAIRDQLLKLPPASAFAADKWLRTALRAFERRSRVPSPMRSVPAIPRPQQRHRHRAYERGDIERVIAHLDELETHPRRQLRAARVADMLRLMVGTGVRPGELCGLHRDDLRGRDLQVVRQRGPKFGDIREYTKTFAGHRTIRLSPAQVTVFERLVEGGRDGWLVCEHWRGPERRMKQAFEAAGVDWKGGAHALRHTSATWAIGAAPIAVVSARLGHSSPKMTLARYSHALPQDLDDAAELLDI